MYTKIIYKIRHKISDEWKYQGDTTTFSDSFFGSGEWDKIQGVKTVLGSIRNYLEYSGGNAKLNTAWFHQLRKDMDNWEIVSYNVLVEEVGIIEYHI